ncbi:MAG: formylglycine-generating enzyme family protein, partial [bacterium]
FNRKALTMSRVLTMAREIESKHALFLFDSCFSGTIFKTRALPVPRYITEKSTKPVRQFITAGSAGEEVPAESIFLPTFIRAIEGDGDINKDGYVTGTELGQYLNQKVLSYDKGQTPQYGKIQDPSLDQGDFVFLLPRATRPPPPVVRAEPKPPPPPRQSINAEETLWGIIENSTEPLDFQDYLVEFPKGRFAAAARIKIRRLKRQQQKKETPRVKTAPPPPVPHVPRVEVPPPRPAAIRRDTGRDTRPATWSDSVTGMRFVKVPGGSFRMGCGPWSKNCDPDEKPVRTVRLSTFWMAKTEVTQGQYRKIMGANPSSSKKKGGNFPVESVTWYDVQAFIARLNTRSSAKFRLPTEAEWEYACRGGGQTVSFGTRTGKLNAGLANYSESKRYEGISPVAAYPPNALGLYDMSGNVWEWVADKFATYGKVGTNNPNNQSSGKNRVKRGGAWSDASRYVRCENRVSYPPNSKASFRGFRLAITKPYPRRASPPMAVRPRAALRAPLGRRTWSDSSSGITFVKVSGGSFRMGCGSWTSQCDPDEKPVRAVYVSDFWIGRTEVTQGQYKKIMGANPSSQKNGGKYPVEMISWNDAQAFIRRLNLRSGERFRLPTEAEWEYACRGGGRKVKFGTRSGGIGKGLANYTASKRYKNISPVASYPPNRLGLYDMSGNVWEWVSDKFANYNKVGSRDPNYQGSGSKYVKRGGSWTDGSQYVRCANRVSYRPNSRNSVRGFRLAITSPYGARRR